MSEKDFFHNLLEPTQEPLSYQPTTSKKILKKSFSTLVAVSFFLQQTVPAWATEKPNLDNSEELLKKISSTPVSSAPFTKANFQTPHDLLDDLLFSSLKEESLGELNYKSSLDMISFFKKLDSSSEEERKKICQSISVFSFGRAFIVSYLMEPLFFQLPCLEILYNLEEKKVIHFKEPKSKNPPPLGYLTSQETWQHIYGFKNPIYLVYPLMQQEIPFGIKSLLINLLPELELLKFTYRFNELFQNQSTSFSILPLGIERIYQRWTNLIACLKDHPHSTYQGLLQRLQPLEARYYQKKVWEHPNNLTEVYCLIQNKDPNWPSLVKELFPQHPFHEKDFQRLYGINERALFKLEFPIAYETLLSLFNTVDLRHCLSQHKERVFDLLLWLGQHYPEKDKFPSHPSWRDPKVWKKVHDYYFERMKTGEFSNQQAVQAYEVLTQYALNLEIILQSTKEKQGTPFSVNKLHEVLEGSTQEQNLLLPIKGLLKAGEDPNALNQNKQTPLDLALEKNYYQIADLLVKEGGKTVNEAIGLKFFQAVSNKGKTLEYQILQKLLRCNPHIAWNALWQDWSQTSSKDDIKIQTLSFGERVIPAALAERLFPLTISPRKLKKTENFGNSAVAKVDWKGIPIYFKEAPAFPGLGYAVTELIHAMIGYVAPLSEFSFIDGIPYLLSQGIDGVNLRTVLEDDPTLKTIKWKEKKIPLMWDEESLFNLLIMSMILNPEDGRADNYVVEEHPDKPGKFRLIPIDNDQAFVPGIAKGEQGQNIVQVKCLPFCFPEMQMPFPQTVKDHFKKLEPFEILTQWLDKLIQHHTTFIEMGRQDRSLQKKTFWLHPTYVDKKTYYGIPFVQNMLGNLYSRMKTIHKVFNNLDAAVTLTPAQLLEDVDHLLAKKYMPQKNESVQTRFKRIESTANDIKSSTAFEAFKRSIEIPHIQDLSKAIQLNKEMGPNKGLTEMLRKAKDLAWKDIEPDAKAFKTILTSEDRGEFLRQKVKFNVLDTPATALWIETITKTDTTDVTITGSRFLTMQMLKGYPSFLKKLEKLNLSGCTSLKGEELIEELANHAHALQFLDLSYTSIQNFSLPSRDKFETDFSWLVGRKTIVFQSLRHLFLNGCKNIEVINLNCPLEQLEVRECLLLERVNLEEDSLKRLAIEGGMNLSTEWIDRWIKRGNTKVMVDKKTANGSYSQILEVIPSYPCFGETSLQLHGKKLTKEIIKSLSNILEANKNLTDLDLDGAIVGEEEMGVLIKVLKTNTTLSSLKMCDTNTKRQRGFFHPTCCTALMEVLKGNSSLTKLDISDVHMGSEQAEALAKILQDNTTLKSLKPGYSVGAEGGKALAGALRKNTTLTHLDMHRREIGYEGGIAFGEALKNNSTLKNLDLSDNRSMIWIKNSHYPYTGDGCHDREKEKALANAFGKIFGEALKSNTTLTALNLSDNYIGDEGIKALAEGLENNTTLMHFELNDNNAHSYNYKSAAIEKPFGEVLEKNTTLTTLSLSRNTIGYGRGKFLAKGLKKNITLIDLNLSYCSLNEEEGETFAKALKKNTTLTFLNLFQNSVEKKGGKAFADVLKSNTILKSLDLRNNCSEGLCSLEEDFVEALKNNTTLIELKLQSKLEWYRMCGHYLGPSAFSNSSGSNKVDHLLERNKKLSCSAYIPLTSSQTFSLPPNHISEDLTPRIRHQQEEDWVYTGLSIDGGGMRGLIPALMLEQLEEVSGKKLYQMFDYVGGTSIGGILSLGIAATEDGVNPTTQMSELVNLFKEQGQTIFPLSWNKLRGIRSAKYDPQPLERLLEGYFKNLTLKNVLTDVVITGAVHGTGRPMIFDSRQAILSEEHNYYLRSIGRATSAAPTFFSAAQIWNIKGTASFTVDDGGVGLNDPTPLLCNRLSHMAEEQHLDRHNFFILSLGTGDLELHIPHEKAGKWGWLVGGGGGAIINTVMEAPMHFVRQLVGEQYNKNVLRLQPELYLDWEDYKEDPPPLTTKKINMSEAPLDNAEPKYLKLYEAAARHVAWKAFGEKGSPTSLVRWFQENADRKRPNELWSNDSWEPYSKPVIKFKEDSDEKKKHKDVDSFLKPSINQAKIGPRVIPGWQLQDVEDFGNCFYDAVTHQMAIVKHGFLETVPKGTLPRDSLRLRIQGPDFKDEEWAEDEQIDEFVKQFDVILAVVDTRNPGVGYVYYYLGEGGNVITHVPESGTSLPNNKPTIRLAATGNHFLSVVSEGVKS